MSAVISQEKFEEGRAAKAAGLTYQDDPYRAGSQDSADWLAGFTADEPEPSALGPGTNGAGFTAVV
ncbi:hypothetical protein [Methylobacterium organophilum]|uniref:Uncharacterized protein n=1 Tax=Methylobacterium organophilum TaxID=410 RepID=A0ABQ4TCR8_METOR|nr:hypothetical protein [Methylobacterium organophilum]UMY16172.1 hypothetical protein MMB17_15770 [Methylobacterium organophilum]GJE28856.1 hypothetical protein LKMONMHP_3730 [Methylobacterium organophilum]